MASITNHANGFRTLQVVALDGKRYSIRLGKVSKRVAEATKAHVEELVACKKTGQPVSAELRGWLDSIDDTIHQRLETAGLAEPQARATLAAFIEMYFRSRSDVKPATRTVWTRTEKHLVSFFGADAFLKDIGEPDARAFRQYLVEHGLAEATVRRTIGIAKQFFNAAIRKHLITRNPFDEYECGHWYARAMASYAMLQSLGGARYDAVDKVLYLEPTIKGDFRCFLATATGYGHVGVNNGKPFVEVAAGTIDSWPPSAARRRAGAGRDIPMTSPTPPLRKFLREFDVGVVIAVMPRVPRLHRESPDGS